MKRFATTIALTTLALAVPAASAGAATDYSGPSEAGGTISFTKDGNKLKRFEFQAIPVNCKDTPAATTSGNLTFNEKIKRGKFKIRAISGNQSNPRASLSVNGKINGGNASGTFQVEGRKLRIDQGGRDKCNSGKLDWNASEVLRASAGESGFSFSRR